MLKRILFPLNKNFDSTSRNEGFVKKMRFLYAEKLLSPARIYYIYIKRVEDGFSIVGEKVLYKKLVHLNLNNGFQ